MNKIIFDTFYLNSKEIDTISLSHRLYNQELRLILLTEYKDNELSFRNKLKIKIKEQLQTNDSEYELYCYSNKDKYKILLGTCQVIDKIDDYIIVKPIKIYVKSKENNGYTDNIKDLFIPLSKKLKNNNEFSDTYKQYNKLYKKYLEDVDKDKYINGLFKYYYKYLISIFESNDNFFSIQKMTAMNSYLIAKDFFKQKNVSLPNVFIKNTNIEFDMLILNTKKHKKFIYDYDDVDSIVELKSNGIIGYNIDDTKKNKKYNNKRWFHAYVTFDNSFFNVKDRNKKYDMCYIDNHHVSKKYNDQIEKIRKLKYYYFCFIETNLKSQLKYENTFFDLLLAGRDKYKGIYLAIKEDSYHFTIPIDFDIDFFQ